MGINYKQFCGKEKLYFMHVQTVRFHAVKVPAAYPQTAHAHVMPTSCTPKPNVRVRFPTKGAGTINSISWKKETELLTI